MAEYISREDALNFEMEIEADLEEIPAISKGMAYYSDYIKSVPAAKVVARKTGTWIKLDSCMAICSRCNTVGCGTRFCANCGARMVAYDV